MTCGSRLIVLVLGVSSLCWGVSNVMSQPQSSTERRAAANKQFLQGNFRDAFLLFHALCLDPRNSGKEVAEDAKRGVECLQQLGRLGELDDFLESAVSTHPTNWRLLRTVAEHYLQNEHHGFKIAGKFERGPHRGSGEIVNALERDRVRALQLLTQAMKLIVKENDKHEVAMFYLALADHLLYDRGAYEAWRLQYLTNLTELPDYEEGYPNLRETVGAPVDENGDPVFYQAATSWDVAENDGQRWRWALDQAIENEPQQKTTVRLRLADFLRQQFGVETLAQSPFAAFWGHQDDDAHPTKSSIVALETMGEDETTARLAVGVRRFKLPDEFNFIKIYQQVAAEPELGGGEQALNTLAEIFENRRQLPQAAAYWKRSIDLYGRGSEDSKQKRLNQIVAKWGRFDATMTQPAGTGATLGWRFRNATEVEFEARQIDVNKLLEDIKAYIKSNPRQLDWERTNIDGIGWLLVQKKATQYLGKRVASWKETLKPRENHSDRRVSITTPLRDAGAYYVTARVQGGNESHIVVWLADSAIVKKPVSDKTLYYVADARTGAPIPNANLEFFGWRQMNDRGNRPRIETTNFSEKTDADGQVFSPLTTQPSDHQWLVVARNPKGRLAFLGFHGVWGGQPYDQEYNQTKTFVITDRPVYRPGQKVQYKVWIRKAQYDQEEKSEFAGQSFPIEVLDPRGQKGFTANVQSDEYAGATGEFTLDTDATLGVYHLQLPGYGSGTFRVEEYKKPEFEVTVDAPSEPVMLGDEITAKIRAKYYFGSPVTTATVKYKIHRTEYAQGWYPRAPWDWCFGPGYWWFGYDYSWYPGWSTWVGCKRPIPNWWPQNPQPPELVAESELPMGPDGEMNLKIDTALAKAIHGDRDHQYEITAEVRDESRRTIVGQGRVLVAREPFKVFSWVDRGYYRVGDTIHAQFRAQMLDQKPVQGSGTLTLLRVTYNQDRQPVEAPIQKWSLDTNDQGEAELKIKASEQGQYRLSYRVTDAKEHSIEGGYLFTIVGDGFDGKKFRFNDLELIPEQREYQPGDKVRLQINTDRTDSTVLLFIRPANGVYLPPKVIRLDGKSSVEEIAVIKKDMPNFFIEAVTISAGKVHSEVKEIVVPPEKRVLNVEILPSKSEFKPGEKGRVRVHLTDFYGENFVGSTALSIYDKSLEYISQGSNIPDIKKFFWEWRRQHHVHDENSLARYSDNLIQPNAQPMGNVGLFGESAADEMVSDDGLALDGRQGIRKTPRSDPMMVRGGAGVMRGMAMSAAAAEGAPPLAKSFAADAGVPANPQSVVTVSNPMLIEPSIRSNFVDTALWAGSLLTDRTGIGEVELDMPENLTTWKIRVWGMGHGTKVGSGDAEVVTRKNLIVRLQAPRFFVQNDEVVLSANVHNYLAVDKEVNVELEISEGTLSSLDPTTVKIMVPAQGEKRVDWRVRVLEEGLASVRMKALTDEESDAMEMKLPCHVHGMLKTDSWAGTVRPDKDGATVSIHVPAERRPAQTALEVRYSPTLAGAMVDALPYLVDYPYGCTEQTLNRFLPTVITQKVLREMNLNLDEIRDKRTNLNAQEIGDARERAEQWQRFEQNPVFDTAEVERMVKSGVTALTNMQVSDGGWGWFSGWGEQSYPHTTAIVVHGLQIARQNDVALVPGVIERGVEWLNRYQQTQVEWLKNAPKQIKPWKDHADNLDALIYMVLVDGGSDNPEMRELLYRDRIHLAVYGKTMLGMALHRLDDREKLAVVLENLEQFLVEDGENETAYLRLPENSVWWLWYGSDIEANAYYLKLLSRTDPQGEAAPRLVKYLLNNRKHATYWQSTRDTAVCVEAFADYIRASGEARPNMTVEIWWDGDKVKDVAISGENLFSFDDRFMLLGREVADGDHRLEIRRQGTGPVYYNAYLTNFTLEDPITKAGLEVKVDRKYYRLVPLKKEIKVAGSRGQPVDQVVDKFERHLLASGDQVKSGDLMEIELQIESKNDYEYLIFEDMKAAGCEPFNVRSGYNSSGLNAYMELRDDRISLFVRQLARGRHSLRYRMRAEIPGRFSALPTWAYAMYAPELRGNSDELKLVIED